MDNKDVPPKLFHRPRLDSLSVPNLVNQYHDHIPSSTNKSYNNSHSNQPKTANINDVSFTTYRNENALVSYC